MKILSLPSTVALLLWFDPCWAAAPELYSAAAYQSPTRADADDLLLLPGYGLGGGDTVVYQAVVGGGPSIAAPASIPARSTAARGIADLVSVADAPYSLTIHLPAAINNDRSYALWVVNSKGEWSNAVSINDARPLWITPDEVYQSAVHASLPRKLKVVGRNLRPATGKATRVRLIGRSSSYTLPALTHGPDSRAIDRYVAEVQLPGHMVIGAYRVQVSRDGSDWVPLINPGPGPAQALVVIADPKPAARFPVGRYTFGACNAAAGRCPGVRGRCEPDGDNDQTRCIAAAIAAAGSAGGGTVVLPRGTWKMTDPGTWVPGQSFSTKGVSSDGILVPDGVSLQGASSSTCLLVRGPNWPMTMPSFALQGHNTVSGVTFQDAHVYQSKDTGSAMLTLGVRWDRAKLYRPTDPTAVSHVVIAHNSFEKPFYAIGSAGLAIDHLSITDNVFGAFNTAINVDADPSNTTYRYRFSHSVVTDNTFFPGSYLDTEIGQGTIATQLSGGYQIDFSHNIADGTSTRYLQDPSTDAKGWRAAYFWSMGDNVEMMLVSQNSATCSGDKAGDGEAIAYDNNHNRPGFMNLAVPVLVASSDPAAGTSMVTVQGSLIEKQVSYGRSIDVQPVGHYYLGDWLQVLQGPGIGQARKISAIRTASTSNGPTVSFTVTPAFDVLPQAGSLVTDGRIFWQTYTIDNIIDHRMPLCQKSNRTRQAGGLITLYAQSADSVVEGNAQFDTSGIQVVHQFELIDATAGVTFPTSLSQQFTEIRGNLVSGTYNDDDLSPQAEYGIAADFAATPATEPPPTLSYGLSISHNTVARAGAMKGAISMKQGWYTGPRSRLTGGGTPWKMAEAALAFKNTLTDIGQAGAKRVGIGISAADPGTPIEWRTVLYGNVCNGTAPPTLGLADLGTATVRYCPSVPTGSCECERPAVDLRVTGAASASSAEVGATITYSLRVANNGPNPASGAALSVEPGAGLAINWLSAGPSICNTADRNVNLCQLGAIPAGASVPVTARATIKRPGLISADFSVTHQEPDAHPGNDSLKISVTGRSK